MIVVGMAALGVLVGVFAAWSATPIVTTLLPLLFGIVGGISGASIAKMDVSTSKSNLKITLLGRMLAAFSIACTLAVVIGVYFRPRVQEIDRVTLVYGTNSADYVDGLVLRRKLEALGASPREIGYVFELLNQEPKTSFTDVDKKVDEVMGGTYGLAARQRATDKGQTDSEQTSRMSDPDQWPKPGEFPIPANKAEQGDGKNEKPKFPLAYQPWMGNPFDSLLWGYGGGAAYPGLQPEPPRLEPFSLRRQG